MTISSTGYDRSVNEAAWPRVSSYLGSPPGVAGADSIQARVTSDTQIILGPGTLHGSGVTDNVNAESVISLTTPVAGTRHDCIVARRNWATNTTSFAVVSGGTDRMVPPLTHTDELDDQPLYLVQVSADAPPVITDDLRITWSTNGQAHGEFGSLGAHLGTKWLDAEGHRWISTPDGVQREWVPQQPEIPPIPTVVSESSAVSFQNGVGVITHRLGWRPDRVIITSRVTVASGLVSLYLSTQPGAISETAFTVVAKLRTATGWSPYTGGLSYVDWTAHRDQPPPVFLPGQVAPPPPPLVLPEEESETPVVSGSGKDLVRIDTGVAPAPQIPIPDTPPEYKSVSPVVSSVDTILATAAREIGTKESPAGSNKVKYWLDEKPSWNGSAWCACFSAWVYRRNAISVNDVLRPNLTDNNPYYTPYLESAAKAKALWYTGTPRPGDMVIFGGSANTHAVHVEIVEQFISSTGRVQTIGGNTSDGLNGSPSNGGGVWRNRRNPKSASLPIRGYIRMPTSVPVNLQVRGPFPLPAGHYFGVADATSALDHDGRADNSQGVKQIQAEVGAAVDGVFGAATETLVKAWQKAMLRTQTGRVYLADWDTFRGSIPAPPRPTGVVATALDRSARVVFNASSGASQYTAVSSTGQTATGAGSPLTLTGLMPGRGVTITVTATSVGGASPESARSNMVWPSEKGRQTILVKDESWIPSWSGSADTPEMVRAVTLNNLDDTTYRAITGKLPAADWTKAIQQATRNAVAVLYGSDFPAPRTLATLPVEFIADPQVLAQIIVTVPKMQIGALGRTAANVGSWLSHESVHLVASDNTKYETDKDVAGLIEGIADYVLVVMGLHGSNMRPKGGGTAWNDGYDTTAFFLHYVAHDAPTPSPGFVRTLNQQIKSSTWTKAQITDINARRLTVEQLWTEYKTWVAKL